METAFPCLEPGSLLWVNKIINPVPTQVGQPPTVAWMSPPRQMKAVNQTPRSRLDIDLWVNLEQEDTARKPRECAPTFHATVRRLYNPGCWDFHHCLTMFSTVKTKRRAKKPQRGPALPRTGTLLRNLPVQGRVGTLRDSLQEVPTSWDTRVYPKCSNLISEPRESLNCYMIQHI
jgi:hypothetical protein